MQFENILALKIKINETINWSFNNEISLINTTNDVFRLKLNSIEEVGKKFAAIFNKILSDTNYLEPNLNNYVNLVQFLDDKDLFSNYYKRYLTKRLLTNSLISLQLEYSIIRRLRSIPSNTRYDDNMSLFFF